MARLLSLPLVLFGLALVVGALCHAAYAEEADCRTKPRWAQEQCEQRQEDKAREEAYR